MKAFKVVMVVVDHGEFGERELMTNLQQMRYYNPNVLTIEEADIGEWSDDHPLNLGGTHINEILEYFDN